MKSFPIEVYFYHTLGTQDTRERQAKQIGVEHHHTQDEEKQNKKHTTIAVGHHHTQDEETHHNSCLTPPYTRR